MVVSLLYLKISLELLKPQQTWSSASKGGCQVGRGMIWAVRAATPLYHEELELVGARLSGPVLFREETFGGRRFDSRSAPAGMTEPSFSVTFRNPGSEVALPGMVHNTMASGKETLTILFHLCIIL